jgi:hypothetical protein
MVQVTLLALGQFVGAMVAVAVYLLISRQTGLRFDQDAGVILLVFLLTALALVGAVWGVFVRPWWVYMLVSSVLAMGVLFLSFALMDWVFPGTIAKLGPAGTVFLLPMLAFIFAYPTGGLVQWFIGLARR